MKPVVEENLTTKEQISLHEYILVQKRQTGELTLKNGHQVLQKCFPSHDHFQKVLETHSHPDEFMQWLSTTCSVSYYEPLSLWTIKLADPPAKQDSKPQMIDDWEP